MNFTDLKLRIRTFKYFDQLLISAIIIYPLLWIWQGGSLTDPGYFAYNYQNFFINLNEGITESISFLADFTGAMWLYTFPDLGILGLNALYLIFYYLILIYTYKFLTLQLQRSTLMLLGILCGVMFSVRYIDFMFSRDILSFLFLIMMGYHLLRGLLQQYNFHIILAGMLFTFACLSRLPNLVFVIFLPFIIAYWLYWNKILDLNKLISKTLKLLSLFIAGSLFCLIIFLTTLSVFNLFDIFVGNLGFIQDIASASNSSSYSTNFLLKIYYLETVQKFLPHLIILYSICISLIVLADFALSKKSKLLLWSIITVIAFISFRTYSSFDIRSHIRYFAPALSLLPMVYSIVKKDKFAPLFLLGAGLTFTQVVGSNTGLYMKMIYGMILLLPVTFLCISHYKSIKYKNISFNLKPILYGASIVIIFFSFYSRWGWIYHVGSGYKLRIRAVHKIEHPRMNGIYTIKDLSDHITDLSSTINNHISEDRSLFIFGHQPMFYYLTDTRSPIKDIWLTNSMITPKALFLKLSESIEIRKTFPLIVDTKNSKMGKEGDNKLLAFLQKYNYIKIEEDHQYAIWKKL